MNRKEAHDNIDGMENYKDLHTIHDWIDKIYDEFEDEKLNSCGNCRFYRDCNISFNSATAFKEKHKLNIIPYDFCCNRWEAY